MGRDRTARSRIRRHLTSHGPLEDSEGLATKRLKEAVAYDGSPVAFIQLVAAMERDGELQRDIRGKRTYRIAIAEEMAPTPAVTTQGTDPDDLTIDYDVLARTLLRELIGTPAIASPDATGEESRRIEEERDEYARRLELARAKIDELRSSIHGSREARGSRGKG